MVRPLSFAASSLNVVPAFAGTTTAFGALFLIQFSNSQEFETIIASQRVPRMRADDRLREAINGCVVKKMDCFVASLSCANASRLSQAWRHDGETSSRRLSE
ncbi:MAG: hypothetical protein WDN50_03475 [Bradyrhizobium sp.]